MGRENGAGQRIQTLIRQVIPCRRVIDVGCDHGYTAMGLARREDIGEVLATDISGPSLKKLEIALEAMDGDWRDKITCKQADGLRDLPWDRADALVISGMGGRLVESILKATPDLTLACLQWVLSPQSDLAHFRRYLGSLAFPVQEIMVEEGGKFYTIFDVRPDRSPDTSYGDRLKEADPLALEYGPDLLDRADPVLAQKIKKDLNTYKSILETLSQNPGLKGGERLSKRREEIKKTMGQLKDWLAGQEEGRH